MIAPSLKHNPIRKADLENQLRKVDRDPDLSFYFDSREDGFAARDWWREQGRSLAAPILIFPDWPWPEKETFRAILTLANKHDAAIFRMFYDTFGGEK